MGGFVGVDIFYVISGFLITKIIVSALHENKFSFIEFYARRVKRLLPAAFVVLLATVLFGYFILAPYEYMELVKSAASASIFLANAWFAQNSGYFDQVAEISPLVHMWSLSVEEQFYLLFPAFLVALHRYWGFKGVKLGIIIVFIVSLSLSIVLSPVYPNFSFYLLPTRAWELSLGALLIFLPWQHLRGRFVANAVFVAGLVMVAYGLFFISQKQSYPGYLALFPVVGAALIVISGHSDDSVGKHILSASPMVLLGRFSYSAYLWHWPIISYYRVYVSERSFYWYEIVALVIVSLIAGFLSWRFIEERFRYRTLSSLRTIAYGSAALGMVLIVSSGVYLADGFPDRISVYAHSITDAKQMWQWECTEEIKPFKDSKYTYCVVGTKWSEAKVKGLIWGDSHSSHWAPLFHQLAKERGISMLIAPRKCPPYLNVDYVKEYYPKYPTFTEDCTKSQRMTVSWLNEHKDVQLVVMAAAWSGHARQIYTDVEPYNNSPKRTMFENSSEIGSRLSGIALRRTIERINMNGRNILLLGDIPRSNRNLNKCAFNEFTTLLRVPCKSPHAYLDASRIKAWHSASDQVLKNIAADNDSITTILPTEKMCSSQKCQTYFNGELIYKDGNHLRRNLVPETLKVIGSKLGLPAFLDNILVSKPFDRHTL